MNDLRILILLPFLILLAACSSTPGERVALLPGDKAPDFTLKTLDGSREVNLASYRGTRPVVLIFGSYT